jgi:hypothetical protein
VSSVCGIFFAQNAKKALVKGRSPL